MIAMRRSVALPRRSIGLGTARRPALAAVLGIEILALIACAPDRGSGPRPKHVLAITVDGLATEAMSCYTAARETTSLATDPVELADGRAMAIDDLAATGVVFARSKAPAGPLRARVACFLSGVASKDEADARDSAPWPAAFARAGFETAAFVTRASEPDAAALESLAGGAFATFEHGDDDADTLARARRWLEQDFGDGRRACVWIHLADPARGGAPAELTRRLASFLESAFDYETSALESTELWSRTLLVFAGLGAADSDRTALLFRHPDTIPGARVLEVETHLRDVGPTLLECFALGPASRTAGRSLAAELGGRAAPQAREAKLR